MNFQIKNRRTSEVMFECELTAEFSSQSFSFQLGFAVRKAVEAKADLRDAVLRGAVLRGADLRGAVLRGADLRGADLSDADWIPRIANIHQTVYAAARDEGALDMGTWHAGNYCGTTHCRAGWVTVLAGPGGKVLEGVYGTPAAAALIYQASDPTLERIPDFYCDNETALKDMERLASEEAARAA